MANRLRRTRIARALAPAACALMALGALAPPALASFHLMQIEQVVGGVCGDTTAQAIQLRMRSSGQHFVSGTSLVLYDAAGANPVTLLTFPANAANGAAGARILVASASFAASHDPAPDFTLSSLIPPSRLAAGRLAFQLGSTIYWSLSWGGAGYTGSTTGATDNDADGDFGPAYGGELLASGAALRFQGAAGAASTSNAADYATTSGGATFVNNAGTTGALLPCPQFTDGFETGSPSAWSRAVP
jgi:hypothetical protein